MPFFLAECVQAHYHETYINTDTFPLPRPLPVMHLVSGPCGTMLTHSRLATCGEGGGLQDWKYMVLVSAEFMRLGLHKSCVICVSLLGLHGSG